MKRFDHQSGGYMPVGSANIYYEFGGTPNKPILLVLHGGFGTLEDINVLLDEPGEQFTLLGIDSPGHGKSTMGNEQLTYRRIQEDVEAVLSHLKIDRLSVIGFSDGGIVAYRLAAFTDLKIDKLITIDSRWHYKNAENAKEALQGVTAKGWKEKFPDTFTKYRQLNPEPDFEKLTEALKAMWLDKSENGYPNEAVKKYTGPLLIIRGDDDPLVSLDDIAELKKTVKHSAFLNVPFAGHAPFATQKEIVTTGLRKFLKNN